MQELEEEILSPNRDVERIKSELGDLFLRLSTFHVIMTYKRKKPSTKQTRNSTSVLHI